MILVWLFQGHQSSWILKQTAISAYSSSCSMQCDFNQTGQLCGKCKENYTLAIGSSHCIHCPNNNTLALLIFFIAAGFLLVFLLGVLNLTVTQGRINGSTQTSYGLTKIYFLNRKECQISLQHSLKYCYFCGCLTHCFCYLCSG